MKTFDEVYRVAREVAADGRSYRDVAESVGLKPDYDGTLECRYYSEYGEPMCLVGQVLDRLGLGCLLHEGVTVEGLDDVQAEVDGRAVRFLSGAQLRQDTYPDMSWSACIDEAVEAMDLAT